MDFMNQIHLHVINFRGSNIQQNKFVNIKFNAFDKKQIEINRLQALPIDVIHGIQENAGHIHQIEAYTIHTIMSFFLINMNFIYVPFSYYNSVITLPYPK